MRLFARPCDRHLICHGQMAVVHSASEVDHAELGRVAYLVATCLRCSRGLSGYVKYSARCTCLLRKKTNSFHAHHGSYTAGTIVSIDVPRFSLDVILVAMLGQKAHLSPKDAREVAKSLEWAAHMAELNRKRGGLD